MVCVCVCSLVRLVCYRRYPVSGLIRTSGTGVEIPALHMATAINFWSHISNRGEGEK